jgi:hypothetical protein
LPAVKLKKREWVIAGVVFTLVFAFLMDRIILSGMRLKLKDLKVKIKNEEERLLSGMQIEKKKDEVIADYNYYKPYLNIEGSDREIMTSFLKEVEELTQSSGGSVVSLIPKHEYEQTSNRIKYLADLQIDIEPQQLFIFLNKIQESKLLIQIDSFSLSPKNEQANTFRFNASLSIAIYSEQK